MILPDKPAEKSWRCDACGTSLGMVFRDASNVRRLRIVTDRTTVVVGWEAEVSCPECNVVNTWYVGEDAMQELLDRWLARAVPSRRGPGQRSTATR